MVHALDEAVAVEAHRAGTQSQGRDQDPAMMAVKTGGMGMGETAGICVVRKEVAAEGAAVPEVAHQTLHPG